MDQYPITQDDVMKRYMLSIKERVHRINDAARSVNEDAYHLLDNIGTILNEAENNGFGLGAWSRAINSAGTSLKQRVALNCETKMNISKNQSQINISRDVEDRQHISSHIKRLQDISNSLRSKQDQSIEVPSSKSKKHLQTIDSETHPKFNKSRNRLPKKVSRSSHHNQIFNGRIYRKVSGRSNVPMMKNRIDHRNSTHTIEAMSIPSKDETNFVVIKANSTPTINENGICLKYLCDNSSTLSNSEKLMKYNIPPKQDDRTEIIGGESSEFHDSDYPYPSVIPYPERMESKYGETINNSTIGTTTTAISSERTYKYFGDTDEKVVEDGDRRKDENISTQTDSNNNWFQKVLNEKLENQQLMMQEARKRMKDETCCQCDDGMKKQTETSIMKEKLIERQNNSHQNDKDEEKETYETEQEEEEETDKTEEEDDDEEQKSGDVKIEMKKKNQTEIKREESYVYLPDVHDVPLIPKISNLIKLEEKENCGKPKGNSRTKIYENLSENEHSCPPIIVMESAQNLGNSQPMKDMNEMRNIPTNIINTIIHLVNMTDLILNVMKDLILIITTSLNLIIMTNRSEEEVHEKESEFIHKETHRRVKRGHHDHRHHGHHRHHHHHHRRRYGSRISDSSPSRTKDVEKKLFDDKEKSNGKAMLAKFSWRNDDIYKQLSDEDKTTTKYQKMTKGEVTRPKKNHTYSNKHKKEKIEHHHKTGPIKHQRITKQIRNNKSVKKRKSIKPQSIGRMPQKKTKQITKVIGKKNKKDKMKEKPKTKKKKNKRKIMKKFPIGESEDDKFSDEQEQFDRKSLRRAHSCCRAAYPSGTIICRKTSSGEKCCKNKCSRDATRRRYETYDKSKYW
ncbi:hypothetical protein SNEBB_011281 [Seison nebaliae]|nr:hypothetical protein SNEBB_011281 [Seison nebaliae]